MEGRLSCCRNGVDTPRVVRGERFALRIAPSARDPHLRGGADMAHGIRWVGLDVHAHDRDRDLRSGQGRADDEAGGGPPARAAAVTVPSVEHEQLRDVVRCREDIRVDLMRARHRLSKFLLRHEIYCEGSGRAWSRQHRGWLASLRFSNRASQLTIGDSQRWGCAPRSASSIVSSIPISSRATSGSSRQRTPAASAGWQ
jgi:hypothetical protein